jgi:hypothetical protein
MTTKFMTKEMRMALAHRIAAHDPPGIVRPVDKELLAKTAARLQRSVEVLLALPCDPRPN